MKKILPLLITTVLLSVSSKAQNIQRPTYNAYNTQSNPNYFQFKTDYLNYLNQQYPLAAPDESSEIESFLRMDYLWRPKVTPHGNTDIYYKALSTIASSQSFGPSPFNVPWKELGPRVNMNLANGTTSSIDGIGPLNFISFDPDNSNIMFVGSWSGGLFVSYDAGMTWVNAGTDNLNPLPSAAHCVATKGSTNKTWFLATGDGDGFSEPGGNRTWGVYRSSNLGTSWDLIGDANQLLAGWTDMQGYHITWDWQIKKLLSDPSNPTILYVTTSNGIFKTTDALNPIPSSIVWQRIYPIAPLSGIQYLGYDIMFQENGTGTCTSCTDLIATISTIDYNNSAQKDCQILTSNNGGTSWNVLPGTYNVTQGRLRANFRMSKANPNIGYFWLLTPYSYSGNQGIRVYKYDFNTQISTLISSNISILGPNVGSDGIGGVIQGTTGNANALAVSPTNANHVVYGFLKGVRRSLNGGINWFADPNYLSVHDDLEHSEFDPTGQFLFLATHGGLFRIEVSNGNIQEMNNGLGIQEVTSFDDAGNDANRMVIAAFHDGCTTSNAPYSSLNYQGGWLRENFFGDGIGAGVGENNNMEYYTNQNSIGGYRSGNSNWSSLGTSSNEFYSSFEVNKNNNQYVYLSSDNLKASSTGTPPFNIITNWSQAPYNLLNLIVVGRCHSAPTNGNYLYTYTGNQTAAGLTYFDIFRIWYTTQAMSANPTWQEITSLFPWTGGNPRSIGDMVVDENDHKVVYVVTQGLEDPNVNPGPYLNKVFKLDLNNNTVIDISSNLPNISINQIVQLKSADNTLIIGTDLGVYYTNNTTLTNNPNNAWSSFGASLPYANVTGLKINKCVGVVRVSTYGRGIWECPLPQNSGIYDIYDNSGIINVNTNTTWNTSHKVIGTVKINPGATLSITGNSTIIEFADTKASGVVTGIKVMPGGKLVVNGATLTNRQGCASLMWDGILIGGNPLLAQNLTNQGVVFLQNNCTIQNARTAISIGQDLASDQGGYLVGVLANFLNNNIDVHMAPYSAPLVSGNEPNNKTNFHNCNFRSDRLLTDLSYVDMFNNPRITDKHVELNRVKGIVFDKCLFKTYLGVNNIPINYNSDARAYGIYSTDATFSVTNKSIFENLRFGVNAQSTNPLKTFTIDQNTFRNCYASLYESGINFSTVTTNTFEITSTLPIIGGKGCFLNPNSPNCLCYFHYLNQCNGFTHQLNQFSVIGNQQVFGTIFNNLSPSTGNITNLNTYLHCYRSNQVQKTGLGTGGVTNLSIKCNQSSNVMHADIFVTSGTLPAQGYCPGNSPLTPANNTFSNNIPTPPSSINTTNNFYYFYNPNVANMVPQYTNLSPSFALPCNFTNGVPFSIACPPPASGCGINCRMVNASADLNTSISLSLPLKQGNDFSLYAAINSSMSDGNLKNLLMAKSPYLSDGVLLAYLNRTITPPNGHIKDIIILNSPVTQSIITKINTLNLPNGIMNVINKAQTGISARQELNIEITAYLNHRQFELNYAISLLLNDTILTNKDSLLKVLLRLSGGVRERGGDLVNVYLDKGQFTDAQLLIDSIKAIPELTKRGNFLQHQKDLRQQGKTWKEIKTNPILRNDILTLAMDSTADGFSNARGVFTMIEGMSGYDFIEDVAINQGARTIITNQAIELIGDNSYQLLAYPNPTAGLLVIKYNLNDPTCNDAILNLVEISTGRLLLKKNVSCNLNETEISLKDFPNGVYSLSIQSNLNAPKTIKIIKVQ